MRWIHLCLTAPSRFNGQPTGMSESSRHPSPFCSIAVPKRGIYIYRCFEIDVRAIAVPCFRREEASLATSAMASNFW